MKPISSDRRLFAGLLSLGLLFASATSAIAAEPPASAPRVGKSVPAAKKASAAGKPSPSVPKDRLSTLGGGVKQPVRPTGTASAATQ